MAIFVATGFAVRWDVKGETTTLAGCIIECFTDLATGRVKIFALPFQILTVWMISAIALGWILQCILVLFVSTREKSKPSA